MDMILTGIVAYVVIVGLWSFFNTEDRHPTRSVAWVALFLVGVPYAIGYLAQR